MKIPLERMRMASAARAATANSSDFWQQQANQALRNAVIVSLLVHAAIIFGLKFKMPDVKEIKMPPKAIEVVLVNSKSKIKPTKADTLAQANLDGGGNTDAKVRAKSNLPSTKDSMEVIAQDESQAQQRVRELEAQTKTLMTQLRSKKAITQNDELKPDKKAQTDISGVLATTLKTSQLEAQLEAQIAKELKAYQQRPKRTFIGARAQEYRFAAYVEDWREKIEKVGTENFPDAAKQRKLYGQLQMTVGIKSDGSIESIEMNKSSGHRILDAAAERILQLASPFKPFPPEIRKDTDVLHITRTWTFTRADQLISE
ncbi:MAG: TonB family protein [Burkholderiales bacterium]